jgi:hypothetical protein
LRRVRLPPLSCQLDGCRFSLGYDTWVSFAAPAGTASLAPLLVFATDATLGYPHYVKHFPWLTGTAVVEQLRMAWRSARLTVAQGREDALVWVVEHGALVETFDDERIKLIAKPCSSYRRDKHCCSGCTRERPDRMTLRSVQPWAAFGFDEVLHTDVDDVDVAEYLSDQPERWIGMAFEIARRPPWRNPWPSEFHYEVPIVADGRVVLARVLASRAQATALDGDPEAFCRDHVVVFSPRGARGMLKAYFVRRRQT